MRINNLKFNRKLILLQILPLAGMFIFATYGILGKMDQYSEMQKVERLSFLATKLSGLVHELQKERGNTAVFLGSDGRKFKTELSDQRKITDQKRQEFDAFLNEFEVNDFGSSFKSSLSATVQKLSQLATKRTQISALEISGGEAISYYTSVNTGALNLIGSISSVSSDTTIANINSGYVNLLKGKERSGIERAVLSNAFSLNKISDKAYEKFILLSAQQGVFFDVFLQIATKSQIDIFQQKKQLPVLEELERMKGIIYDKKSTGNFQIDPKHWFNTATTRINDLKEIEDAISSDLILFAKGAASDAKGTLIMFMAVFLSAIILSILVGIIISRSVVGALTELNSVMLNVDKNSDLTLRVNVAGSDEIAQMGLAFNEMLQRFSNLISNIRSSSHQLNMSSSEMMERSELSTKEIKQQLLEIDRMAEAKDKLNDSAKGVTLHANDASEATHKADGQAGDGSRLVTGATDSINILVRELEATTKIIHELEEDSNTIGSVLDVIRSIAEQTNLLALNAAIEAARAGEYGRGFAVVADEVRNLASRTQESTEEVQVMIERLQQGSSSAVSAVAKGGEQAQKSAELANKATLSIGEISKAVTHISKMSNQIALTAKEQDGIVDEISQQIESVSSISNRTSEDVQKTAESSIQLASLATELEREVNEFKV